MDTFPICHLRETSLVKKNLWFLQPLEMRATGAGLGILGGLAWVELCDRELWVGYPPGVPHKLMGRVSEPHLSWLTHSHPY